MDEGIQFVWQFLKRTIVNTEIFRNGRRGATFPRSNAAVCCKTHPDSKQLAALSEQNAEARFFAEFVTLSRRWTRWLQKEFG